VKALLTGGGLRAYLFNQPSVDLKTLRWFFDLGKLLFYILTLPLSRSCFSMQSVRIAGVSIEFMGPISRSRLFCCDLQIREVVGSATLQIELEDVTLLPWRLIVGFAV
jgi:hypothetical protein